MNVEELIVRLRIEEDNRRSEKKGSFQFEVKANVVEHGQSSKFKKRTTKGVNLGPKGGISKKQKFQGKCFNCDKMGHKAAECILPRKNKNKEANVMEKITQEVDDMNLSAVVSEVNLIGSNPKEWWIDTGATRHVCSDRNMFTSFDPIDNGEKLFMGNSATSDIRGQGKVILKMTSGKSLTLNNVPYVPEICKNLVSGSLLNKHGFRMVFESDKVILSKSGMFVGKGYVCNGLFKLNVMTVKPKTTNKASTSSAYLLESSSLWHGRLRHVNYGSLRRLINLSHIPTFQIDNNNKCETYVEAKMTRSSFQTIERNTEPLDMIHSDICDLKFAPTRGGNKYFITFVDDSTKYCYVYLLKSKDEALENFVFYKAEVENQLNKKIKVIRSDRGGEYVTPIGDYCGQHGIRHEVTPPYSPQSNGVAERKM